MLIDELRMFVTDSKKSKYDRIYEQTKDFLIESTKTRSRGGFSNLYVDMRIDLPSLDVQKLYKQLIEEFENEQLKVEIQHSGQQTIYVFLDWS